MKELTQEQKELFKRKEEELKAKFTEPKYLEYTIKYIKDASKADLTISKQHNIFDYLAIGIACLAKEIQDCNGEKTIYAVHKNYPSIEAVQLHDILLGTKSGGHSLANNALMELFEEPSIILEQYFADKNYANFLGGILLYSIITATVMGYAENPDLILDFENFNDTIAAQKLAFETLKKLIISNCLGTLHAFLFGDD